MSNLLHADMARLVFVELARSLIVTNVAEVMELDVILTVSSEN